MSAAAALAVALAAIMPALPGLAVSLAAITPALLGLALGCGSLLRFLAMAGRFFFVCLRDLPGSPARAWLWRWILAAVGGWRCCDKLNTRRRHLYGEGQGHCM